MHRIERRPITLIVAGLLLTVLMVTSTPRPTSAATDPANPADTPVQAAALTSPAVAIAMSKGNGFWIATSAGDVYPYGSAGAYGDLGDLALNAPIVSMVATATGLGYWLIAADGGVFAFGDAPFHGSTGNLRLNRPVVSMAPTADGGGYWLVASDGGVFAFGNAGFHGSTGNITLNQPIFGITRSPSGLGYRMVASDGGIFSFGDAPFYGSLVGGPTEAPVLPMTRVIGMAPTRADDGYWIVNDAGQIFGFGGAFRYGSLPGRPVAVTPSGVGLRAVFADGSTRGYFESSALPETTPPPPYPAPTPPTLRSADLVCETSYGGSARIVVLVHGSTGATWSVLQPFNGVAPIAWFPDGVVQIEGSISLFGRPDPVHVVGTIHLQYDPDSQGPLPPVPFDVAFDETVSGCPR
jgi:hypothetical protein